MPRNAQGGYDKQNQPDWKNPAEVQEYRNWLSGAIGNEKQAEDNRVRSILSGTGYNVTPDMLNRAGDTNYGAEVGRRAFETPEMMQMQRLREDLAKGYSGEAGGAIRETARREIAGQQQAQARRLGSAAARGGVGGARGAAMQAANARKGGEAVADAERKMAVDSFQMQTKGADSLQDYLFRKKFAELGSGAAYASMGSADRAAAAGRAANQEQSGGFMSELSGILMNPLTPIAGAVPAKFLKDTFGIG